ncbi:MAG: hypothetical protein KJO07_18300 [Deltaproteobacteria bacterium]|nr:hypothetical protein [Deltaproteobacteria bacterium]
MKRALSLVIAFSLLSAACVKEDDPPDLPPAGSMTVDLAAVEAAPLVAKGEPNTQTIVPVQYENFAQAWVRVKVLQLFAVGVIVVPGTAIALALSQEPTESNGVWTWTVTVNSATAELDVSAGLASGWDVDLYVTDPQQSLDRYLWVEGDSNLDVTEGTWTLHDPELTGNDEALAIEWSYTTDTDRSLAYVVRNSEIPESGDSITFTVAGTTASVTYVDADDPSVMAEISWDTTTGAGQITVPGFNGGAAACWDELFENADCP